MTKSGISKGKWESVPNGTEGNVEIISDIAAKIATVYDSENSNESENNVELILDAAETYVASKMKPSQLYATLDISIKLLKSIQAIEPLWMCISTDEEAHQGEYQALNKMKSDIDGFLKHVI